MKVLFVYKQENLFQNIVWTSKNQVTNLIKELTKKRVDYTIICFTQY